MGRARGTPPREARRETRPARSLAEALERTRLRVAPRRYALLSFPREETERVADLLRGLRPGTPGGAVAERDGWTVILPEDRVPSPLGRSVRTTRGLRLLTFTVPMGWGVVGFLARVTGALADARVAVLAVSTFDRDHLLVRSADLARARTALRGIRGGERRSLDRRRRIE